MVCVCGGGAVSEGVAAHKSHMCHHSGMHVFCLWLPFQHPLSIVGAYLPLPVWATCGSVAVNTLYGGMIVLALIVDLTQSPFPRARRGRWWPKQLFLSRPSLLPAGAHERSVLPCQSCSHDCSPPCSCVNSVLRHHLVHHIYAAVCGVVKGDCVWFAFGSILSLNHTVHAAENGDNLLLFGLITPVSMAPMVGNT